MEQLKTFYILTEYCCNHFEGIYSEWEFPQLAEYYLGKNFKFDTFEELNDALNKEGYTLSKRTI